MMGTDELSPCCHVVLKYSAEKYVCVVCGLIYPLDQFGRLPIHHKYTKETTVTRYLKTKKIL